MTLPLYHKQKHTADKAASYTGQLVIYAVQVHANGADGDVELCDAVTNTSSDELSYSALDGDTLFFDYTPFGGVVFNTGLSIDVTGTGVSVILWTSVVTVAA